MAFASANRTSIHYIAESAWGTTPATPTLKEVRLTGESLNANIEYITSNELRSDRMKSDLVQVAQAAGGGIDFELSYGSFDDFLSFVMMADWSTNVLKNGTTPKSCTIQKAFNDLAAVTYQNFPGSMFNGMSLNFETGSILTGSFDVLCKGANMTTTQITGATLTPSGTTDVMNAVANVSGIEVDGAPSTAFFSSLTMNMNNNLRQQRAIGNLDAIGIGLGSIDLTGNINIYFENMTEYNKFRNNTYFSFQFTVTDAATNAYTFLFPKVKYESMSIVATGLDTDVMAEATWRAIRDATEAAMVRVDRAPAA